MPKHLNIPPVWTVIAIAAAFMLHALFPLELIRLRAIDKAIVLIGLIMIVWPIFLLRQNNTTVVPRQKPTALLVEGPFKISRNPMYLGMGMVALGVGLMLGSLQALLPAIWLFWFLNKNYVIPEERKMKEAMGEAAEAYFEATGRWLWFL